jgi:DNA-binding NarL/FixJ family response regulator
MKDEYQLSEKVKKVLLIDDQILFREGLISLFNSTTDFEMVGSAGSVHEGIEQAIEYQPDIILMDFSLPDGTGLDATRAILSRLPNCKIVFLTVYTEDETLFAALRMGAKGYMLKNVNSADLLSSLRALERGENAISRKMISSVMKEFSNPTFTDGTQGKLLTKLSRREIEVLREIESGATNIEIAQRLFLSENTVKHHIRNVFEKLGVENRREAALVARQNSIVSKYSTPDSDLANQI